MKATHEGVYQPARVGHSAPCCPKTQSTSKTAEELVENRVRLFVCMRSLPRGTCTAVFIFVTKLTEAEQRPKTNCAAAWHGRGDGIEA